MTSGFLCMSRWFFLTALVFFGWSLRVYLVKSKITIVRIWRQSFWIIMDLTFWHVEAFSLKCCSVKIKRTKSSLAQPWKFKDNFYVCLVIKIAWTTPDTVCRRRKNSNKKYWTRVHSTTDLTLDPAALELKYFTFPITKGRPFIRLMSVHSNLPKAIASITSTLCPIYYLTAPSYVCAE